MNYLNLIDIRRRRAELRVQVWERRLSRLREAKPLPVTRLEFKDGKTDNFKEYMAYQGWRLREKSLQHTIWETKTYYCSWKYYLTGSPSGWTTVD